MSACAAKPPKRGQISTDELLLLQPSQVARSLLQEITICDPLSFSLRTPEEILHQITEGVRGEERAAAEVRIGALQKSMMEEQSARFAAIAEADRFHARTTKIAQRIAGIAAMTASIALALAWIGLFTRLTMATGASGWIRTAALVVTVLLSAASVIVPMVNALSLSSRLKDRIASFLKAKILER